MVQAPMGGLSAVARIRAEKDAVTSVEASVPGGLATSEAKAARLEAGTYAPGGPHGMTVQYPPGSVGAVLKNMKLDLKVEPATNLIP